MAPRIDRRLARSLLVHSLPLLLSGIAGTANEFIDRQMVLWLTPGGSEYALEQLGVYGGCHQARRGDELFTSMYRLAAEPFFLAEFKGDDFRRTNAEAMKYFIIVSIFIFLAHRSVPRPVRPDSRTRFPRGSVDTAHCAALQYAVGYRAESLLLVQADRSDEIRYLRDRYGAAVHRGIQHPARSVARLRGAAVARLVCESAMVALSYLLNRRYCPVPYDLKRIGEYVLLGALLYGAGVLCGGLTGWLRYLIYLVLVVIFAGYAVRSGANRFGRIGEVGHPPWTIIVRRHKITGLWSLKL